MSSCEAYSVRIIGEKGLSFGIGAGARCRVSQMAYAHVSRQILDALAISKHFRRLTVPLH